MFVNISWPLALISYISIHDVLMGLGVYLLGQGIVIGFKSPVQI